MGNAEEMKPLATQTENEGQVGLQLRKARKINRLSIDMVASQLRIDARVIAALEDDDFSQLMPVYARGYLRNYARLVNLPVEPLLEAYSRRINAETVSPRSSPRDSKGSNARWGLYLLVAALSVPLLLWVGDEARLLFGTMRNDRSGAITSEAQTSASVLPGHEVPVSPSDPAESKTVSVEPSARPPLTEDAAANTGPAGLTAQPGTPGEMVQTASPTSAMSLASPSVGQGPDNITVHVSADAWVAIRDQTGHRLASETLSAGTSRSYFGQAPFAVVLGNSPATRLELNGQLFDQPKPKSGTVARFQLGESRHEGAATDH